MQLSNNWENIKLGNIVDIKTGKLDVNANISGGKYPFFTCAREVYEIDIYAFEGESILIAGNGDLNIKYYDGKFNAYQRTYVLQNFKADGKYLYYVLENNLKLLRSGSRGSTIKYIRLGDLTEMIIPLPSLQTQQLIVSEIEKQFSRLDEGLSSLLKIRQNLKNYRASILKSAAEGRLTEEWRKEQKDIVPASVLLVRILEERKRKFLSENPGKNYKEPKGVNTENLPTLKLPDGWELVRLEQITSVISDGDHNPPPKAENGIPFITISNITNNTIDFSKTFFVSDEYFSELKITRRPIKGDILYTVTGSFGIPVLINYEPNFCFQRHVGLIRPVYLFQQKYLFYLLQSGLIFHQASKSATGTAQKTVGLESIRNFTVPLPPLAEQQKIIEEVEYRLSIVDELEQTIDAGIKKSENLKQSILKRAFSGSLI